MDKTKEKEIAKLIEEDIEREARAPLPWQHGLWKHLDRIERMLKWLVKKNQIDYFANVGIHASGDQRERCKKDIKAFVKNLPDISDIIDQKK